MRADGTNGDRRGLESIRRGVLREVNERIAALTLQFAAGEPARSAQFICECADPACTEPVTVTLDLYESVRAEPRRYLIAINHEDPEGETVIFSGEGHAVVETLAGTASKIAETTDPRRSARLADLVGERSRSLRSVDVGDAR
jgi:hypothetical protein